MKRRSMLMLPLLFFTCLLFSLCNAKSSHEAIQLLNFMNSPESLRDIRDARWTILNRKNGVKAPMSPQDGLMSADKIDALPGQPQGVNSDQYAGYITVDSINGRALFYYFVEASEDPSSKPLILWLNGGPGCSSLGYGAMQEVGPFIVNSDGKTLRANDAAWNNVANIIFLESPVGVGFSYSNTSSDYKIIGDKSTANDSYTFLINWLERFPQYKTRDFFITGESYAGHYIPELASLILKENAANKSTIIQLKGIAMGNAYVDVSMNKKARFDYLWSHALIATETLKNVQSTCNFSASIISADCKKATRIAINEVGNINPYDIYAPLCKEGSNANTSVRPDPCEDDYVNNYLNLVEVQKAFHVNGHALPHSWSACSSMEWHDAPATLVPTVEELIATGLRVWFYSGDQDSVVPVTSTRYSIDNLGLPVESQWQAWSSDDEVGGYVIGYKGLTLATVRGAGHTVPSYQPGRALTMISAFLKGRF